MGIDGLEITTPQFHFPGGGMPVQVPRKRLCLRLRRVSTRHVLDKALPALCRIERFHARRAEMCGGALRRGIVAGDAICQPRPPESQSELNGKSGVPHRNGTVALFMYIGPAHRRDLGQWPPENRMFRSDGFLPNGSVSRSAQVKNIPRMTLNKIL